MKLCASPEGLRVSNDWSPRVYPASSDASRTTVAEFKGGGLPNHGSAGTSGRSIQGAEAVG
jgi:hypothetical protein